MIDFSSQKVYNTFCSLTAEKVMNRAFPREDFFVYPV